MKRLFIEQPLAFSGFSLLFPKDSESQIFLDIKLWEVGAKRRFNSTLKVNTRKNKHTHGQTDTNRDKSTYRKHRPRGPMLSIS